MGLAARLAGRAFGLIAGAGCAVVMLAAWHEPAVPMSLRVFAVSLAVISVIRPSIGLCVLAGFLPMAFPLQAYAAARIPGATVGELLLLAFLAGAVPRLAFTRSTPSPLRWPAVLIGALVAAGGIVSLAATQQTSLSVPVYFGAIWRHVSTAYFVDSHNFGDLKPRGHVDRGTHARGRCRPGGPARSGRRARRRTDGRRRRRRRRRVFSESSGRDLVAFARADGCGHAGCRQHPVQPVLHRYQCRGIALRAVPRAGDLDDDGGPPVSLRGRHFPARRGGVARRVARGAGGRRGGPCHRLAGVTPAGAHPALSRSGWRHRPGRCARS